MSFHLTGSVIFQNTHVWSIRNPHTTHGTPLQTVKLGMFSTVSRLGIVGPIFFQNTNNLEHYIDTDHEFVGHLAEE
jgi:hypothetical protein